MAQAQDPLGAQLGDPRRAGGEGEGEGKVSLRKSCPSRDLKDHRSKDGASSSRDGGTGEPGVSCEYGMQEVGMAGTPWRGREFTLWRELETVENHRRVLFRG